MSKRKNTSNPSVARPEVPPPDAQQRRLAGALAAGLRAAILAVRAEQDRCAEQVLEQLAELDGWAAGGAVPELSKRYARACVEDDPDMGTMLHSGPLDLADVLDHLHRLAGGIGPEGEPTAAALFVELFGSMGDDLHGWTKATARATDATTKAIQDYYSAHPEAPAFPSDHPDTQGALLAFMDSAAAACAEPWQLAALAKWDWGACPTVDSYQALLAAVQTGLVPAAKHTSA